MGIWNGYVYNNICSANNGYSNKDPYKKVEAPESLLGNFLGWNNQQMIYKSHDKCPNNKNRITKVKFECGSEEHIKEAKEDGMCQYFIKFVTPLFCSKKELIQIKQELEFLKEHKEDEL